MIRVGIVADDLTGAGDTAAQFVRAGWNTELQLCPGKSAAAVVAVITDSRALSAQDAAGAVTRAVRQLREMGMTHLYKKIDSTLRGQIRAEVRVTLESWSRDAVAVVCPAFPAMGRTVVDGQLRVEGVPVSETALGADPVTPVLESHIPTLLGASHVARRDAESPESLADRIIASGPIVVVDAAGEDELRTLAGAVVRLGSHVIPVGSAGLARHLAILWNANRSSPTTTLQEDLVKGIAVVIVTSQQDVARRQAAAVASAGAHHYEPAPADLIDDEAWARESAAAIDGLKTLDSTLLLTAPADRSARLPAALIAQRLAELAARVIRRSAHGRVSGVVVTGGDGARALMDALGATGIQIRDEVITGVPIGTLVGGPAHGLKVVTKAGGFGDADTLLQAVQAVRCRAYA